MSDGVKAREGEEVWVNTLGGRFWYTVTQGDKEKLMHVRGGQRFRLATSDREMMSADISSPDRDPFLNGSLKRVDERAPMEPIEGYDPEQALEQKDLLALLGKSGNAFQSAVKKLNEKNARQLKEIVDAEDSTASGSQRTFVVQYVEENFKHGGQTSSGEELLSEPE